MNVISAFFPKRHCRADDSQRRGAVVLSLHHIRHAHADGSPVTGRIHLGIDQFVSGCDQSVSRDVENIEQDE